MTKLVNQIIMNIIAKNGVPWITAKSAPGKP
jgi:hypothetical protein